MSKLSLSALDVRRGSHRMQVRIGRAVAREHQNKNSPNATKKTIHVNSQNNSTNQDNITNDTHSTIENTSKGKRATTSGRRSGGRPVSAMADGQALPAGVLGSAGEWVERAPNTYARHRIAIPVTLGSALR